jgi:hypothetical protein
MTEKLYEIRIRARKANDEIQGHEKEVERLEGVKKGGRPNP